MEKGIVQLYTGDGKGKTTASLGLAFRALGRGFKVAIIQFLKSRESGELLLAERLSPDLEIRRFNSQKKFAFKMDEGEKALLKRETLKGVDYIRELFREESVDLVIADELVWVNNEGFLSIDEMRELCALKPASIELVMTGRNASPELVELADLVTEMKKIKHPFDSGLPARVGIEK